MPPQENLLVHLGSTTFVLTITDGVVYFMFRPPYLLKLLQVVLCQDLVQVKMRFSSS